MPPGKNYANVAHCSLRSFREQQLMYALFCKLREALENLQRESDNREDGVANWASLSMFVISADRNGKKSMNR